MMRNGENLPLGAGRVIRWAELREMAKLAEQIGVDTLFAPDHLIFRNAGSIVVPEGESRGAWESWTLISALVAATSRVTIGPFVACTSFRNPALLAKMADTLDEVSDGRLLLAVGAGWHEPEYAAFGYPFDHRASRFAEAIRIIAPLLRQGYVDFAGRYYTARDCELRPRGPRPQGPPIWIGAKGPRMMRVVARHADAYNTMPHATPESLAQPWQRLEEACRDVGRDPATIMRTAACLVTLAGAEDEPAGVPPNAIDGTSAEVAARLHALHQAGVEHMNVFLGPWTLRGIEQFAHVLEELRQLES
jgi:probable F420-dependent oxidoreductase